MGFLVIVKTITAYRYLMNFDTEYQQYYTINEDGVFSCSSTGIERFRALFTKSGINISNVTTLKLFKYAIKTSEPYREEQIYTCRKNCNTLESQALIAILKGNHDKTRHCLQKIERIKKQDQKLYPDIYFKINHRLITKKFITIISLTL